MKQIQVPEGMLKAAESAWVEEGFDALSMSALPSFLEAALRWLSENPIVPTREKVDEMAKNLNMQKCWSTNSWGMRISEEWQRRMFLTPEPEVPEGLWDLLYRTRDTLPSGFLVACGESDRRVIEAFRRGQNSR